MSCSWVTYSDPNGLVEPVYVECVGALLSRQQVRRALGQLKPPFVCSAQMQNHSKRDSDKKVSHKFLLQCFL